MHLVVIRTCMHNLLLGVTNVRCCIASKTAGHLVTKFAKPHQLPQQTKFKAISQTAQALFIVAEILVVSIVLTSILNDYKSQPVWNAL